MKTNEFRIGNLIYPNDENATPYEIKGVMTDKVFFGIDRMNEEMWQDIEEIEPIPLTEDMLNKMGFEKTKNKVVYDVVVYDFHGFQLNKVVNHKWDTYTNWNNNKNYITANGAAIQYVHQLQNLYFTLTGQELTTPHTSIT